MPLKLNVGLSKKIGQSNYGSLGASCHVEVELDQSLVFDDPEGFQERVTQAYAACRQAISQELDRHQALWPATKLPIARRARKRPINNKRMLRPTGITAIGPRRSNSIMPASWPVRFAAWVCAAWRTWPKRCSPSRWPSCRASMPRA